MPTKIELDVVTGYDIELLEMGILCRLIRLRGRIKLMKSNEWSKEYRGIIDTGSPVSLIPLSIWQEISFELLSNKEFPVLGIAKEGALPIMAKFCSTNIVFIDSANVSSNIKIKAYLLPTDHIPLILGFEDILTEATLLCDYKNLSAYLKF